MLAEHEDVELRGRRFGHAQLTSKIPRGGRGREGGLSAPRRGPAQPLLFPAGCRYVVFVTFRPTGKENDMRLFAVLAVLAVMVTGLVGCKAEGEVGDAHTSVSSPL